MKNPIYIVGIDEAGRGALAGPVVVGVVLIPKNEKLNPPQMPKLKDSKKLSPRQREMWYEYVRQHPKIIFHTARVYPKKIDAYNISYSANLAASRALDGLFGKIELKNLPEIILDGGLYLGKTSHLSIASKTIVRGDEKRTSIKLASIVAKVTRDRYLVKLNSRYPQYGLGRHKGYGTRAHFSNIKKYGPSKIHRLTYLKKKID